MHVNNIDVQSLNSYILLNLQNVTYSNVAQLMTATWKYRFKDLQELWKKKCHLSLFYVLIIAQISEGCEEQGFFLLGHLHRF